MPLAGAEAHQAAGPGLKDHREIGLHSAPPIRLCDRKHVAHLHLKYVWGLLGRMADDQRQIDVRVGAIRLGEPARPVQDHLGDPGVEALLGQLKCKLLANTVSAAGDNSPAILFGTISAPLQIRLVTKSTLVGGARKRRKTRLISL